MLAANPDHLPLPSGFAGLLTIVFVKLVLDGSGPNKPDTRVMHALTPDAMAPTTRALMPGWVNCVLLIPMARVPQAAHRNARTMRSRVSFT